MTPRLSAAEIVTTAWSYSFGGEPPYTPLLGDRIVKPWRHVAAARGWHVALWPDGTCAQLQRWERGALITAYNIARDMIEEEESHG